MIGLAGVWWSEHWSWNIRAFFHEKTTPSPKKFENSSNESKLTFQANALEKSVPPVLGFVGGLELFKMRLMDGWKPQNFEGGGVKCGLAAPLELDFEAPSWLGPF